jgi:hypothetical protein
MTVSQRTGTDRRTVAAAKRLFEATEGLPQNIHQAMLIDPDAVCGHTRYDRSTVEAVLNAFTLTGLTDIDGAITRFFRGDKPLRTTPIVTDQQG